MGSITNSLRNITFIVLLIGITCELIFFPSWANFAGCMMTSVVFLFYSYQLKQEYIRKNFFSFLMLTTLFLYRFIPLFATLVEGKPITHGFELAYETFFYETLLFLIGLLAYKLAQNRSIKKNLLQRTFYKLKLFEVTPNQIWILGGIGLLARLYTLSATDIEYGDIGGKFIQGFKYLMYCPILLLFPKLLNIDYKISKKSPIIYLVIISIINLSTNSREALITPIGIYILLFVLSTLQERKKITEVISLKRLVILSIFLIFGLNFFSNLSIAMLKVRGMRNDIDKIELAQQTFKTLQNEEEMSSLRSLADEADGHVEGYDKGWSEVYISNFMLNRYANLRLSDRTIDLAQKIGYGNETMKEYYWNRLLALLPTPILKALNISIDKNQLQASPGDMLYGLGQSGIIKTKKIVASHIGVGLATFGYSFFILQFLVWFILFKLLNALTIFAQGKWLYSIFGLIQIFEFLGFLRNAGGIFKDSSFMLRGFWEGIVTFLICLYISKKIVKLLPNFKREN